MYRDERYDGYSRVPFSRGDPRGLQGQMGQRGHMQQPGYREPQGRAYDPYSDGMGHMGMAQMGQAAYDDSYDYGGYVDQGYYNGTFADMGGAPGAGSAPLHKQRNHHAGGCSAPLHNQQKTVRRQDMRAARASGLMSSSSGASGLMKPSSRDFYLDSLEQNHHDEYVRYLAGAKLVGGLESMNRSSVGVEPNSVYGAIVMMPQLSRSLGWPKSMVALCVSAAAHYVFCLFLHGILLTYIAKSETIIAAFGGQMYLCDYAKNMDVCTEGPGCTGPGGTVSTPPRLYGWDQWATRLFVRDSLKALFPDRVDEIQTIADPGEYGMESYWCRIVCCLVFVVSIVQELDLVFRMFRLVILVPTRNESWIELKVSEEESSPDPDKWLEEVTVKVQGMSIFWKVINAVCVLLPKSILWLWTATAGINFLMETSSIEGIIVNSVALNFLLSFDELITDALMTKQTNFLLDKCEDYTIPHVNDMKIHSHSADAHAVELFLEKEHRNLWKILPDLLTKKLHKLLFCFVLVWVMMHSYYVEHCDWRDGRWVAKDLHVPKAMKFDFWNAFFSSIFPVETHSEVAWSYDKPYTR